MNPNSTRKRPPKMTPRTIAARLSNRGAPSRTKAACYHSDRVGTSGSRALPAHADNSGRACGRSARRRLLRSRGRIGRVGAARPAALRIRAEDRRRPAGRGLALPSRKLEPVRDRSGAGAPGQLLLGPGAPIAPAGFELRATAAEIAAAL